MYDGVIFDIYYGGSTIYIGKAGYLWSSQANINLTKAYSFDIEPTIVNNNLSTGRYWGHPLRCLAI